jgi:pimeloyl-ACP methyl ester carboxylesterase
MVMRRVVPALISGALVMAACSSSDAAPAPKTREITSIPSTSVTTAAPPTTGRPGQAPPPATQPPQPLDYEIAWEETSGRVDSGRLTVPLDYADPQGETIDLYLARHRADGDRVGILLVNNGGPGSPASSMAVNATSWFQPALTSRFDVIAWDPRGTGVSDGAVDCIDDGEYDRFYATGDITPDDDAEKNELVAIAEEFAQRCIDRVGRPLQYIGTNNSARDMDAIRQALGEEQASYFGFSYGSELGAAWATMYPTTVRAAVLDGASDPNADSIEATRQQWVGFEAALNTFLAECSSDSSCAFHNDGDAEGAFDQLFATLDESPLPGPEGRADIGLGVAVTGVVRAMYSDQFWPTLERSLDDALNGDGEGLLALNDAYYQRRSDGSYSNLLESFQAISCADDPDRPTVEQADAEAERLIGAAPRLFPYTTGSYSCSFFPPAVDPRIEITGIGAGPIVVVGTTGDPSTPLESSREMAGALEDGRLVVVVANQHTGYRVNGCIDDTIHDYLVQLEAPDDETVCG